MYLYITSKMYFHKTAYLTKKYFINRYKNVNSRDFSLTKKIV